MKHVFEFQNAKKALFLGPPPQEKKTLRKGMKKLNNNKYSDDIVEVPQNVQKKQIQPNESKKPNKSNSLDKKLPINNDTQKMTEKKPQKRTLPKTNHVKIARENVHFSKYPQNNHYCRPIYFRKSTSCFYTRHSQKELVRSSSDSRLRYIPLISQNVLRPNLAYKLDKNFILLKQKRNKHDPENLVLQDAGSISTDGLYFNFLFNAFQNASTGRCSTFCDRCSNCLGNPVFDSKDTVLRNDQGVSKVHGSRNGANRVYHGGVHFSRYSKRNSHHPSVHPMNRHFHEEPNFSRNFHNGYDPSQSPVNNQSTQRSKLSGNSKCNSSYASESPRERYFHEEPGFSGDFKCNGSYASESPVNRYFYEECKFPRNSERIGYDPSNKHIHFQNERRNKGYNLSKDSKRNSYDKQLFVRQNQISEQHFLCESFNNKKSDTFQNSIKNKIFKRFDSSGNLEKNLQNQNHSWPIKRQSLCDSLHYPYNFSKSYENFQENLNRQLISNDPDLSSKIKNDNSKTFPQFGNHINSQQKTLQSKDFTKYDNVERFRYSKNIQDSQKHKGQYQKLHLLNNHKKPLLHFPKAKSYSFLEDTQPLFFTKSQKHVLINNHPPYHPNLIKSQIELNYSLQQTVHLEKQRSMSLSQPEYSQYSWFSKRLKKEPQTHLELNQFEKNECNKHNTTFCINKTIELSKRSKSESFLLQKRKGNSKTQHPTNKITRSQSAFFCSEMKDLHFADFLGKNCFSNIKTHSPIYHSKKYKNNGLRSLLGAFQCPISLKTYFFRNRSCFLFVDKKFTNQKNQDFRNSISVKSDSAQCFPSSFDSGTLKCSHKAQRRDSSFLQKDIQSFSMPLKENSRFSKSNTHGSDSSLGDNHFFSKSNTHGLNSSLEEGFHSSKRDILCLNSAFKENSCFLQENIHGLNGALGENSLLSKRGILAQNILINDSNKYSITKNSLIRKIHSTPPITMHKKSEHENLHQFRKQLWKKHIQNYTLKNLQKASDQIINDFVEKVNYNKFPKYDAFFKNNKELFALMNDEDDDSSDYMPKHYHRLYNQTKYNNCLSFKGLEHEYHSNHNDLSNDGLFKDNRMNSLGISGKSDYENSPNEGLLQIKRLDSLGISGKSYYENSLNEGLLRINRLDSLGISGKSDYMNSHNEGLSKNNRMDSLGISGKSDYGNSLNEGLLQINRLDSLGISAEGLDQSEMEYLHDLRDLKIDTILFEDKHNSQISPESLLIKEAKSNNLQKNQLTNYQNNNILVQNLPHIRRKLENPVLRNQNVILQQMNKEYKLFCERIFVNYFNYKQSLNSKTDQNLTTPERRHKIGIKRLGFCLKSISQLLLDIRSIICEMNLLSESEYRQYLRFMHLSTKPLKKRT